MEITIKANKKEIVDLITEIHGQQLKPIPSTDKSYTQTVTECCEHCGAEVTMEWNAERDGYKAYCPYCGNRLMLCDECDRNSIFCDYNSTTDSCRFNRKEN